MRRAATTQQKRMLQTNLFRMASLSELTDDRSFPVLGPELSSALFRLGLQTRTLEALGLPQLDTGV